MEDKAKIEKCKYSHPHFKNNSIVPELKKIIYGCESWWKTIRSVDEFSKISNEDINNTWYVKLLQSMDQPEEE